MTAITPRPNHLPSARARRTGWSIATAALISMATSGGAWAAEPKALGAFRDWMVFVLDEGQGRACWMASRPKKQEGNFTKRGEAHVLVTHRPAEKAFDTISVLAGYSFAPGGDASVQIGKQEFKLFVDGDGAWARDAATDRAIVQAMRAGTTLVVRGTSARGTKSIDTYSLAGSSAAYDAMSRACGLQGR